MTWLPSGREDSPFFLEGAESLGVVAGSMVGE
jgi:hypothetical protein